MLIFAANEIEAQERKSRQDSNLRSSESDSLSSFTSAEILYFSVSLYLTSFIVETRVLIWANGLRPVLGQKGGRKGKYLEERENLSKHLDM